MTGQAYRLKDICNIKSGKRIPLGMNFSTDITNYPYIRARDIKGGKIQTDDLIYIDDAVFNKIKKYIIKSGDIAITIVGASVGDVAYAQKEVDGFNLTENAVRLTEFNSIVNGKYLFYVLNQEQYHEYMQTVAGGAAQPKLGIYKVERIKVVLPAIKVQNKIVKYLSCLDVAIENNNKRIRLLEQMAENLYKEWFAYHKIKNDAKEVGITDFVSITRGLSYSSEEIECEDGNDLINLKNIQAYGGFRLDGTKKYNGKYKDEQIVIEGDLIMGVTDMTQDRRTVGSVALIPNTSTLSVISADLIKLTSDIDNVYLYAMFRWGNVSRYISQFANGANVLHLRPQVLKNVKVLLPSKAEIDKYVENVKPMIQMINKLNTENNYLSRQRDLLLPRLMSGKLEVNF